MGSNGNKFFGLNPDGTQLFSINTSAAVDGSPAINDYGTVFFGTDGNKLFSVGERYTGFVRGTTKIPVGDCNNNQLAADRRPYVSRRRRPARRAWTSTSTAS